MNTQIPNFEEAANVATEFIYSLDNLPSEVSHILQEIKHKDVRTQELQQEIDKDSAKYIRHSRRASSTSGTPPSPSSRAPSPKSMTIPAKVSASYAEIQELASEKCILAQRLIELVTKTRARLDADIAKVRILQGEPPEPPASQTAKALLPSLSADTFGAPGRNPAQAISDSLRNALAMSPAPDGRFGSSASSPGSPAASSAPATKKRRVTTTTSIKISPAASPTKHRSQSPAATASASHTTQKSRLSKQIHPPVEDIESDAEGEADDGMEEEAEDETLYCFCQKQSYGDMIACDNEGGCPYEWFHLACVGLKQPTPEKWYCSACIKTLKGNAAMPPPPTTATRKGRKK